MKMRRGMSPETFNILVSTLFLVVAVAVAFGIYTLSGVVEARRQEKERQAISAEAIPGREVTYRLEEPVRGPFYFPTQENPWTQAQVDRAGEGVVPLWDMSLEANHRYVLGKANIHLAPEAILALRELCRGLAARGERVQILIEEGYLSYEAAGDKAGMTPLHGGYALQVCLTLSGERVSLSSGRSRAEYAATALWLEKEMAGYGFVTLGETGLWLYVGAPHACAMEEKRLTPTQYISLMYGYSQSSPMVVERGEKRWRVFYLPAHHGGAELTLTVGVIYGVTGNGREGFLVAVVG